jgi:hypothetical protein
VIEPARFYVRQSKTDRLTTYTSSLGWRVEKPPGFEDEGTSERWKGHPRAFSPTDNLDTAPPNLSLDTMGVLMTAGPPAPGQDIYDATKEAEEDEGDASTDMLSSEKEIEQ